MKIDKTSMLFTELTNVEADELRTACTDLVLCGQITEEARHYFKLWSEACQFNERQSLLMMTIAFPQRALLSLVLRDAGIE